MTKITERYERIKRWLNEYGKFVVNERDDDNYRFSFFIWGKEKRKGLIPILIGYLKKPENNQECISIGWGWNLDLQSDVVRDVLNDPDKKSRFISSVRKVIDPKKYLLYFEPNEIELKVIKVIFVYPIDWLSKEQLYNEIIQLWVQQANVILHFELKSGRPTSIDKFRR